MAWQRLRHSIGYNLDENCLYLAPSPSLAHVKVKSIGWGNWVSVEANDLHVVHRHGKNVKTVF